MKDLRKDWNCCNFKKYSNKMETAWMREGDIKFRVHRSYIYILEQETGCKTVWAERKIDWLETDEWLWPWYVLCYGDTKRERTLRSHNCSAAKSFTTNLHSSSLIYKTELRVNNRKKQQQQLKRKVCFHQPKFSFFGSYHEVVNMYSSYRPWPWINKISRS